MTADTMRIRYPRLNLIGIVILLIGITSIIYGMHAVVRHGQDALNIRQCIEKNGPVQIWRSLDKSTFYLLCQLDKGIYGLLAAAADGHEKTAFIPKSGAWNEVIEYIRNLGTRYTGPLPWLAR